MTIRMLAMDLYRAQQKVAQLEKALEESGMDARTGIEEQLRRARSEYKYLQQALDGKIGR